ncbi:CRISPR-associated protein Cas4 [bacterium]|nr:CRISPR-associated protein Cas4 [bacterium]
MKKVTPSLFSMYQICKREAWLHANGINMEQTSETVAEGKLISETTYKQRAAKYTELDLGVAKIDFYDAKNKVVHEVKKSNKMEHAHIWQTKYYLYLLKKMGIDAATGLIEYPKLRTTERVELTNEDEAYIEKAVAAAETLINQKTCPERIEKKFCKSCSYFEFCWVGDG